MEIDIKNDTILSDIWQWSEREIARNAVLRRRRETLTNLIDELAQRIVDCDALIAEGKSDHQYAYDTMVKPQVERILEAKNRFLDHASLPSVIA